MKPDVETNRTSQELPKRNPNSKISELPEIIQGETEEPLLIESNRRFNKLRFLQAF